MTLRRDTEKARAWRKRSKPMDRGTGPKRRTRLPRLNRRRQKSRWATQYHSKARVRFVCALQCVVPGCEGRSENAHNPSRAAGGKYWDVSPTCRAHHREQHRLGIRTWSAKYGVDLTATNARTEAMWREYGVSRQRVGQIVAGGKAA